MKSLMIKCTNKNCDKDFTTKDKMLRHVIEIHLNLKNFQCPICKKFFKRKFHMERH